MYWILDPGHGGMSFGYYLTKGKQSPQVPPGIYEGEFNRSVCEMAQNLRPNIIVTIPGPINVPLKIRAKYINELATKLGPENCALISVHANAMGRRGWDDAKGFTVFHSRTPLRESKRLANVAERCLTEANYAESRGVKKANFGIITFGHKRILKVKIPAILVELGFMTHWDEASLLGLRSTRVMLGRVLADIMSMYEREAA